MENATIASVITENGLSRCISATATSAPGKPGLRISGVTERAAAEIKALVIAAMQTYGLQLPKRTITVGLVFDVPFEATSELALVAFMSLAHVSGIMETE